MKPVTTDIARVALALAILAPLAASAALAQNGPQQQPAPKVRTAVAEERQMAPLVEVPGTVHSRKDARIGAEIAGRVVWVAEVGAVLKAGDEIARLDDRAWRLELQELDAQIRSLQAQLDTASRDAGRMERLAATGNAATAKLDEAQSRREVAAQETVKARARRDHAALNVERAVVRAPFAGQVASRSLELGEFSSPGKEVARLVATDEVEVRVQAPISTAGFLSEGLEVPMQIAGRSAPGRITRIIPVGERQSRTFEVRLALPEGTWVVGSAVKVALPAATPHAVIAAHRDALILRGGGAHVYRVKPDATAERVPVEIGISAGEFIEIKGEVRPGDRLVVRGGERLREGQKVDVDSGIS